MEKTDRALFVYAESDNATRNLNLAFNKYKDLKVVIFKTVSDSQSYNESTFKRQCKDLGIEVIELDLSDIFERAGLRNENVLQLITAHSLAIEANLDTIVINVMKLVNEDFKYRHIVNLQCILNTNTKTIISIDKTILI